MNFLISISKHQGRNNHKGGTASVYLHELLNFKLRQGLTIESNEFTVKKNIHSRFNKLYRKDKKATWCWIQCWKSASKIDHTLNYNYVNQTLQYNYNYVNLCDISDHFLIFVFFKYERPERKTRWSNVNQRIADSISI